MQGMDDEPSDMVVKSDASTSISQASRINYLDIL